MTEQLHERDSCIMVHNKIVPLYFCLPWERRSARKSMFAKQKEPEPILIFSVELRVWITAQTRRLSRQECFHNLTYCIGCLRLFLKCFLFHCILSLNFIQHVLLCEGVFVCMHIYRFLTSGKSLNVSISGASSSKIH